MSSPDVFPQRALSQEHVSRESLSLTCKQLIFVIKRWRPSRDHDVGDALHARDRLGPLLALLWCHLLCTQTHLSGGVRAAVSAICHQGPKALQAPFLSCVGGIAGERQIGLDSEVNKKVLDFLRT